jgi:hypothetical protein
LVMVVLSGELGVGCRWRGWIGAGLLLDIQQWFYSCQEKEGTGGCAPGR